MLPQAIILHIQIINFPEHSSYYPYHHFNHWGMALRTSFSYLSLIPPLSTLVAVLGNIVALNPVTLSSSSFLL